MVKAPIVKEGYIYITVLALLTVFVFEVVSPYWSIIPGVLMGFITFFFRNPQREIPKDDTVIVSPADGKVMSVCEVYDEQFLNEVGIKVTIFLSVFDVHVNRSPIAGEIKFQQYTCGRFRPAYKESVGCENERHSIGLDNGHMRVLVTQIAGLLARRIVSWVTLGSILGKGERYGLIKFASCTEVIVPKTVEILVKKGDRVTGGETVIGEVVDMKSIIPNALTALNLILGIGAIISTFNGEFYYAALFIVAAMISDGLDGRVARYLNASSEFGKELDSLCDLVSFGVAPAILAYAFMLKDLPGMFGYIIAASFATCGALRLARFNVNTSVVKGYFMGLPIPAGGCVIATFIMLGIKPAGLIFPIMVAICAYLMVSNIKYPDFKGKGEKIRLIPVGITLLISGYILFTIQATFLFIPFFAYVLFGILNTLFALFDYKSALNKV